MSKVTQCQRVLEYMNRYGAITALEAQENLGVMRLAARISDLRRSGHSIRGEKVLVKNRFGEACRPMRYTLDKQP